MSRSLREALEMLKSSSNLEEVESAVRVYRQELQNQEGEIHAKEAKLVRASLFLSADLLHTARSRISKKRSKLADAKALLVRSEVRVARKKYQRAVARHAISRTHLELSTRSLEKLTFKNFVDSEIGKVARGLARFHTEWTGDEACALYHFLEKTLL